MITSILNTCYTLELKPKAPFNFEGTLYKPSHFPSSDNIYEKGVYWQTMRYEGKVIGIKMTNNGTIDTPFIKLTIYSAEELQSIEIQKIADEIEYRFDMKSDLSEFYSKFENDQLLCPVLNHWRGMRVSTNVSLYEFLVIATVLQNASVKRSVQMHENLLQKYGFQICFDGKDLFAYWHPESIDKASTEELRTLKVGYRDKQLKKQAELFVKESIDELYLRSLYSNELKKTLLKIYGIGAASVWYIMFEVFKRYDVFEHISPWEQKIYSKLLFNSDDIVDSDTIFTYVDTKWGKWKMLAAHYLFEDLFWKRRMQKIDWLEKLIRL